MRAIYTNKTSVMRFVICSLIVSIVFENVKLFSVFGAAFKPIHVIMIISIAYNLLSRRLVAKDVVVGMFFLLLPILPLYRINDIMEWFKSYFVYAMIVAFFATSLRTFITVFKENYEKYVRLFLATIAFTQVLGVIQFICMNFLEYFFLLDFWGPFQFHANQFGMTNDFYRAYSLFFEPSFLAWVSNSSLCVVLFLNGTLLQKRKRIFYILLSFVTIFCTLSASGIVIALILVLIYLVYRSKNPEKSIISLIGGLIVLLLIMSFTDLLAPIKRIFVEINTKGTSGYERLVTPWLYVQETLKNYPIFGRGFGQEGMVDAVGIIGRYTGVQNSLYGVFVWMGLSGLLIVIPALIYSARKIKENRCWIVLFINLVGIYMSTGAWCSVDTIIFLILLIAVGSKTMLENG